MPDGWILNGYEDWVFAPETALFTVRDHFKVATLDGFGLKDRPAALGAAGAVLHYLTQHLRRDVANLTRITIYQNSDFLALDATTLRHLEVLEPQHQDAPRNASLFGALNRTVTPMGARRLRDWLSQPLRSVLPIGRRQDAVAALIANSDRLEELRLKIGQVRDLERTVGRLSAGTGNARDLVALRAALEQIPHIQGCLEAIKQSPAPSDTAHDLPNLETPLNPGTAPSGTIDLLEELRGCLTPMPEMVEVISRGDCRRATAEFKRGRPHSGWVRPSPG